jgi:hypothetical protein
MTFNLAECSPAEQLAVWEARTNYIGQHLQGAPLHQFARITQSAESAAIRAEIQSGSAEYSPNLIYETALRAVEDSVYDGKLPNVYHIQQLEKLTRKTTVEHYNRLYRDGLTYITSDMMSERLQWTQWLDGMKAPTVKEAVELQFIGATSVGNYPLKDAMIFAAKFDEVHRSNTYASNPFGALRVGGPSANTPYAPNEFLTCSKALWYLHSSR